MRCGSVRNHREGEVALILSGAQLGRGHGIEARGGRLKQTVFFAFAACVLCACPSTKVPRGGLAPIATPVRDAELDAGADCSATLADPVSDAGVPSGPSVFVIAEEDAGAVKAVAGTKPIEIAGLSSYAMHDHGGAAAKLRAARFQVTNRTKVDATLRVKRVEYMVGHSCTEMPTHVSKEPKATNDPIVIHSAESREVEISFEPVEAYYSYCQRFFFRVTFQVGREERQVLAETQVSRVSPMRR